MKKFARVLAVVLSLVMIFACLTACGEKSKIIGKWEESETGLITMEFQKDGDLILGAMGQEEEGEWKISGGKLKIRENADDDWESCKFSIKGKTLKITSDGETLTFKKK